MLSIYCSAYCSPNPGHGIFGYHIYHGSQLVISHKCMYGKNVYNDMVTYIAIYNALKKLKTINTKTSTTIYCNNQLVIDQLNGKRKTRSPAMKNLLQDVNNSLDVFRDLSFQHLSNKDTKIVILKNELTAELQAYVNNPTQAYRLWMGLAESS